MQTRNGTRKLRALVATFALSSSLLLLNGSTTQIDTDYCSGSLNVPADVYGSTTVIINYSWNTTSACDHATISDTYRGYQYGVSVPGPGSDSFTAVAGDYSIYWVLRGGPVEDGFDSQLVLATTNVHIQ